MHTKVLLIDGNAIFSNGVKNLLEENNMEVVATAGNSDEGIRLATQLAPRIILLDTEIPQINSLQVLKKLHSQVPQAKIALLAWQTNSNQLASALQAGANGYLARNIQPDELLTAIRDMLIGKTVVPPELSPILTRFQQAQSDEPVQHAPSELIATLTPREYETLTYLTRGLNNKLIARKMGLTEGTVKIHVKAILSKLNVDTRINAAVLALQHGIGSGLD